MIIILYVVDALRPDHMSCYGYRRKTTSNIDDLCKSSVQFNNAYAQSTWTRTSAVSLLTSMYPSTVGVSHIGDVLPPDIPIMSSTLRENFMTYGISAQPNVSSYYGFSRGFDRFIDLFLYRNIKCSGYSTAAREKVTEVESRVISFPRGEEINKFLFRELQKAKQKNENAFFFCWNNDVHTPLHPLPDHVRFSAGNRRETITHADQRHLRTLEDKEDLINLYDDEVSYVDYCFGNLMQRLKDLDLFEESLIILTSDHGQLLLEHGLIGHGYIPYEELIRIPLIIKLPNQSFRNQVNGTVGLIDVFPTLLELLDIPQNWRLHPDGKSVLPLIKDGSKEWARDIFSDTKSWNVQSTFYSVKSGKWKYIKCIPPEKDLSFFKEVAFYFLHFDNLVEFMENPSYFLRRRVTKENELLFNLEDDPLEKESLSNSVRSILTKMRRKWKSWFMKCQRKKRYVNAVKHREPTGIIRERLQELGYI